MIIVYVGLPGSGKTLKQTIDAYECWKSNAGKVRIYSDYELHFDHSFYDWNNPLDFEGPCVLALDELHMRINSRRWKDKFNIDVTGLFAQFRKKKAYVMTNTHSLHKLDINFRDLVIYVCKCEAFPPPPVTPDMDYRPSFFMFTTGLMQTEDQMRMIKKEILIERDARKYYGLFDTDALVGSYHGKEGQGKA